MLTAPSAQRWTASTALSPSTIPVARCRSAARERAIRAVQRMGYELHVSGAALSLAHGQLDVAVTVTNTGVAPFYYDWPVELGALDADGRLAARWRTDWKLAAIQPGSPAVVWRFSVNPGDLKPIVHHLMLRVAPLHPSECSEE